VSFARKSPGSQAIVHRADRGDGRVRLHTRRRRAAPPRRREGRRARPRRSPHRAGARRPAPPRHRGDALGRELERAEPVRAEPVGRVEVHRVEVQTVLLAIWSASSICPSSSRECVAHLAGEETSTPTNPRRARTRPRSGRAGPSPPSGAGTARRRVRTRRPTNAPAPRSASGRRRTAECPAPGRATRRRGPRRAACLATSSPGLDHHGEPCRPPMLPSDRAAVRDPLRVEAWGRPPYLGTTTRSGACPRTTIGTCSRCSCSRARRRGSLVDDPSQARGLPLGVRRLRRLEGRAVHAARVGRLLQDPSIVRNRLKVESAVENARRALEVHDELGSLDAYLWSFVDGQPIVGAGDRSPTSLPRPRSPAMSKDLKRRVSASRPDGLLRVHAGDRHGQRSRDIVLPVCGTLSPEAAVVSLSGGVPVAPDATEHEEEAPTDGIHEHATRSRSVDGVEDDRHDHCQEPHDDPNGPSQRSLPTHDDPFSQDHKTPLVGNLDGSRDIVLLVHRAVADGLSSPGLRP